MFSEIVREGIFDSANFPAFSLVGDIQRAFNSAQEGKHGKSGSDFSSASRRIVSGLEQRRQRRGAVSWLRARALALLRHRRPSQEVCHCGVHALQVFLVDELAAPL